MTNLYFIVYTLVLIIVCIHGSVLRASKNPIALNLRPIVQVVNVTSTTGVKTYKVATDKAIRSLPVLFQNALGIYPGVPFQFDLSKWRMLQSCGLFANLTAKTIKSNGELFLAISGDELPAIQFAPEFAVGAKTIEKPEVSGNLLFRDNNFRGLGERVELMVSAFSKGIEAGSGELPPSFRFKWVDGIRGRPSSVTFSFEEDHVLEDSFNTVPISCGLSSLKGRVQLAIQKISVNFQGVRNPKLMTPYANEVRYELEPYDIGIGSESSAVDSSSGNRNSHLSGAKFKFSFINPFSSVKSIDLLGDIGTWMNFQSPGSATKTHELYQQTALDIVSSPIPLLQVAKTRSTPPLEVVGQAKLRLMRSWGAGCLPLYHHAPLDDPQYIRGLSNPSFQPRMPEYALLKGDAYLHGWSFGIPGVFIDAGMFKAVRAPKPVASKSSVFGGTKTTATLHSGSLLEMGKQVTIGVSLRSHGLRLDVGSPCTKLQPRVNLALDF